MTQPRKANRRQFVQTMAAASSAAVLGTSVSRAVADLSPNERPVFATIGLRNQGWSITSKSFKFADFAALVDVDENDSHQRIVRAAIAMAQGLDIEVAAEGVETITQLEFLRSCNCDLAQGFLISRPMQPEKVSAILRSEIAGTNLLSRGMP